jgi:hypothetical protein
MCTDRVYHKIIIFSLAYLFIFTILGIYKLKVKFMYVKEKIRKNLLQ